MPRESGQFRRLDLAALVGILATMLGLLAPALAATNRQADLQFCLNQLRNLAAACSNFESARRALPSASTQPITHQPESAEPGQAAGYSWLTMLLPYLGEDACYDQIQTNTTKFQRAPFEPTLEIQVAKWKGHPSRYHLSGAICPLALDGRPVDELQSARGSYFAFTGSHFVNLQGLGRFLTPDEIAQGANHEGNGAVPFPFKPSTENQHQGLGPPNAMTDGLWVTLFLAESREDQGAWIDGQAMWVVAAWPDNKAIPSVRPAFDNPEWKLLGWKPEEREEVFASLEFSGDPPRTEPYLSADRWSGARVRRWGPSSQHPEGVNHAFADGHAATIHPGIDPTHYLHLVTRAGGEAPAPEVSQYFRSNPYVAPYPGIRHAPEQ